MKRYLSALPRNAQRATRNALPLTALLLSLAACTSEDTSAPATTESLATSEITLGCEAESNGEAVLLTVTMHKAGEYTSLLLSGSDRLLASATDAAEQPLLLFDTASYTILLPTAAAQTTLSLARAAETVSAEVVLPDAFALTVPAGPAPSDEAIPLSWEQGAPDDDISVSVDGPCITPFERRLEADTGGYALQPGDLFFSAGIEPCTLAVSVTRRRQGSLALGTSSTLSAAQVRTAALEVVR